jgi:endogenous inhibitor of DNA gyrase (YacG/DUF329 family)
MSGIVRDNLKQGAAHLRRKRMPQCPNCRAPVKPREENEAFPFCSARCRAVDLARWFTGSYRVPGPPSEPQPPKHDDEKQ